MAIPEREKLSKTSPQQANFLRNQIFLSRVVKLRNDSYEKELEEMLLEKKRNHPDLTDKDLDVFSEMFTRKFFRPEYQALAEYKATEEKRDLLLKKSALTYLEKEQLDKFNLTLSIPAAAYATQSLQKPEVITELKEKYRSVSVALKKDIQDIAKSEYANVRASVAHVPATTTLFDRVFPGIKGELSQLSMSKSADQNIKLGAKAALAVLSNGIKYSNPPGALMARGLSAIVMSDAMKPMRNEMEKTMNYVGEKTGLKDWVKNKLKKSDMARNVMIGLGTVAAISLVSLGIIETEVGQEIAKNVIDYVSDIGGVSPEIALADVSDNLDAEFVGLEPSLNSGVINDSVEIVSNDTVELMTDDCKNIEVLERATIMSDIHVMDDEWAELVEITPENNTMELGDVGLPEGIDSNLTSDVYVSEHTISRMADVIDSQLYTPIDTIVEAGDTPYELVAEEFRKAGVSYNYAALESYWALVAEANGIEDIDLIKPGQVIEWSSFDIPADGLDGKDIAQSMLAITDIDLNQCSLSFNESLEYINDFEMEMTSADDIMFNGAVHHYLAELAEKPTLIEAQVMRSSLRM